jgi:glycosyltransferase involved in cell wall biosynthesis
MKIAIVCPSPDPFQYGGVERLSLNLVKAINDNTSHSAEIIKLPFPENTAFRVIRGYLRFNRLNLDNFDAVISLKYPAWMVNHQHHIIYMTHKLRGLYDSYTGKKNLTAFFKENPLNFPGIAIRKIVHLLDKYATDPQKIMHYLAISKEVRSRENYFPNGVDVDILYPPTDLSLDRYSKPQYKYFFTVSRLDKAKRIELIIKSMKFIEEDIDLLIAGDGAEKENLMELALHDLRIKFLGHVDDVTLKGYYKNALCVPFIPFKEDFGLVALEAMKFKKPLITFSDSGGATELIENEETGFIIEPSIEKLAEKMRFFAKNPDEARSYGEKAFESVKDINMKKTAEKILSSLTWMEDLEKVRRSKKMIITIFSTYTIDPPYGGGKARIFHLYNQLSKKYKIFVIALSQTDIAYGFNSINPDFHEIRVPMSGLHKKILWEYESQAKTPVSDVTANDLIQHTPLYSKIVKCYAKISDFLISSHPYLFSLLLDYKDKPIIYESHNVEYNLKKEILDKTHVGKKLLKRVHIIEEQAIKFSRLIFVTSFDEAKELNKLYGVSQDKMVTIPNGVETRRKTRSQYNKESLRKKYDITESKIVIFLGAWHPPNLDAFVFIKDKLCFQFTDVRFIVLGSVIDQYKSIYSKLDIPSNMTVFGNVTEEEKYELFALSDIAINPMSSGSGTNLKMLDFMASELPVLSTSIGARGFDLKVDEHYFQSDLESFSSKLLIILDRPETFLQVAINGSNYIKERFGWEIISEKVEKMLDNLIPRNEKEPIRIDMAKNENFGSGWYSPENWSENLVARWTDGEAVFSHDNSQNFNKMKISIQPGSYNGFIKIFINGRESFNKELLPDWNELEFDISGLSGRLVVSILSPTWSPYQITGTPDTRILGVAVRSITLF